MRPAAGVVRKPPEDGVLRGRVGAKRWLCQLSFILFVSLVLLVVVIVAFAQLKLELLLVVLLLGCLALASLGACFYPFAWLGLDLTLPVVFDLSERELEVGGWRQMIFDRRVVGRAQIKDLRVYRADVDFTADKGTCYDDARPLLDAQVPALGDELPRLGDAMRESGRSFLLCCSTSRRAPGVACAFLVAKVENEEGDEEILQISRCVWRLRDVHSLCELAREARRLTGVEESLPQASVLGAASANEQPEGDARGAPKTEPQGKPQQPAPQSSLWTRLGAGRGTQHGKPAQVTAAASETDGQTSV